MAVRREKALPPMVPPETLAWELDQLALAGKGWAAILRRLSQVLQRPTRLLGVHGGVLAASDRSDGGMEPAEVSALFGADKPQPVLTAQGMALAIPVVAGARRVGVLLADEPLPRVADGVLAAARTAIAIEAVRRDVKAEARVERASQLVDELRFGSLRDGEAVARAAERFGLAMERAHAAAVFAYSGPNRRTWLTALSWIEMPVRVDGDFGWTVLFGDVASELVRIRTRLEGMVGDGPVYGAAGPVVVGVAETIRSFQEAEIVLALLRSTPGRLEMTHASLGLAGLLLGLAPERLRTFVDAHLGPVLDRPELLETLEAWLRNNGSRTAVAEELRLHRNSVGYRIGRIRDLLGVDPLKSEAALQMEAALVARNILNAVKATAASQA